MQETDAELKELYQEWFTTPTPVVCARLAEKLRQGNRASEAEDIARKGQEKWPGNISVNVVLGKSCRDSGDLEGALAAFEKVIAIDPLNLIAIRNLAELHYEKGNWNRCIELFEEFLFEYPGDAEIEKMLRKARESKRNSERDARASETEQVFPLTDRMAGILSSQSRPVPPPVPEGGLDRAPRSLFDLFTPDEREELGLKPYS
jgi:tetratricopeptide (TPR) repeat protein